MSIVTFAAFPVLIGIGIDYAIQFHNRIDEELAKGKPLSEAAISAVNHVAIPVIIALVITEASMATLLSSSVPMINDFGKLCVIGLVMCYLSALFINVTVLYLLEGFFPRKRKAESHSSDGSSVGAYIEMTATFCIEKWKAILTVALVLAVAGNYVDSQVPIETNMQNYIPRIWSL
jgi:predicted RND superfamily exporter protein